jgi:hypothetical protein
MASAPADFTSVHFIGQCSRTTLAPTALHLNSSSNLSGGAPRISTVSLASAVPGRSSVMRCGVDHDEGGSIDKRESGQQCHAYAGASVRTSASPVPERQATGWPASGGHAFANGDDCSVFEPAPKRQWGLDLILVLNDQGDRGN